MLRVIGRGTGKVLRGYQCAVDAVSDAFGWVAKWLVPTCVVVGFVNVLLRYIGRYTHSALTSNRYVELQWMLFGAIFLIGFPYILKHHVNVRVDFLFQNYRPRVKALIDFVGHVIGLLPFCLFAVWATWDQAVTSLYQRAGITNRWSTWRVWEVWEQSPDARGLPRAPIKVLIVVGFFMLLVQTLAELVKLGRALARPEVAAPVVEPDTDVPLRIE